MAESSSNPELHKYTAVDAENTIAVLKMFLGKTSDITDSDYEMYTTAVHGIKSALMNIGETEMSDIALKLERAGDARNLTFIFSETQPFIEGLQKLVEKLKPESPDESNEKSLSDEDRDELHGKLNEVIRACKAYDISTAETILGDLKKKSWPSAVSNSIEELFIGLIRGEIKNVAALAEGITSSL